MVLMGFKNNNNVIEKYFGEFGMVKLLEFLIVISFLVFRKIIRESTIGCGPRLMKLRSLALNLPFLVPLGVIYIYRSRA